MNKTTEALKLAKEALENYGIEGTKSVAGIKCTEALAAIREVLAKPEITTPDVCGEVCARAKLCYGCGKALDEANAKLADHSGDSNEMVADTNPLSVFAKECVLGAYTYDELPGAARLALKRAKKAEPVKQEPKKWVDLTNEEYEMLCQCNAPMDIRVRTVAMALKHKNQGD